MSTSLPILVLCLLSLTNSQHSVQRYNIRDRVPVHVNTVGPYRNPNEKYPFFAKIPFCKPENQKNTDAGSIFMGDRPLLSDYILPFRENIHESKLICTMNLDQNQIKQYLTAIKENFMFEYFVDHELLVTGFLGKEELIISSETEQHMIDEKYITYLFTHWNFHCEYNSEYVISCRITTDLEKQIPIQFGEDISVTFTYSVLWESTEVSVNDRLMYHVRKLVRSQPLEVHWLSTLNSFILVVLVTAFVAIVFTTVLRQDCAKYHQLMDELDEMNDTGWKQLKRDVFRPPKHIMLFSAAIGTGTQLLVLVCSVLCLSLIGLFYPGNRGTLTTAVLFVYCFTAGIAGHISGTLYCKLGGKKWATNAVITACLFPVPFFCIFLIVNTVAVVYESSMVLPFVYILGIFVVWCVITFPLTIYAAKRVKSGEPELEVPTESTSRVPRQIPEHKWYRNPYLQIAVSGILPFTAIYIELHFLFMAIFGHQVYTLFGILSLAFIMLLIVTSAVTIILTYFQLQSEDWRWWWRAFGTAGSTGAYVLVYGIFYYFYRSFMSGILQAAFFFGYISIISYAFVLMLGATGWWSTFKFLKHIYGAIKSA